MADPVALEAVLAFKRNWKPNVTMHLGDFWDLAALRGGSKGTKDEAEPIGLDVDAGTDFLRKLEPNIVFLGNHEDRIMRYMNHPNAIAAYAASQLMGELNDLAAQLRAPIIPYDIDEGWRQYGDTLFGHGYMFNQAAIRDHAESQGKCVIGHLHRVGSESARVRGGAMGYCVGYLGHKPNFSYAKANKSRLAWSQGFAWGEFSDKHTIVRLEEKSPAGWRLPL